MDPRNRTCLNSIVQNEFLPAIIPKFTDCIRSFTASGTSSSAVALAVPVPNLNEPLQPFKTFRSLGYGVSTSVHKDKPVTDLETEIRNYISCSCDDGATWDDPNENAALDWWSLYHNHYLIL